MSKVVIFDLDGTLADSLDMLEDTALEILKHKLPPDFSKKDFSKYRDKNPRQIIKLLGLNKLELLYYVFKGRKIIKNKRSSLKPIKGIPEVVSRLNQRGFKLYVASSNSKLVVDDFLKNNNLDKYFSGTWGRLGFLSKATKLNKIITYLALDKKDVIYIGDELKDIESCGNIKLKCISVTWGLNSSTSLNLNNPGMVVDSTTELLKKIEKWA